MKKICHISTVHSIFDTRIFYKELKTLVNEGFETCFIIAHDKEECIDGISIIPLPKTRNRIERMIKQPIRAFKMAKKLNADIYHFHDPELIPIGLKLKKSGKKVIYDVHEDLPRQLLSKSYIPKFIRKTISKILEIYENYTSKKFDYIITATPFIRDRFLKNGCKAIDIQNMPILSEFIDIYHDWNAKEKAVCYIGGITKIRGINEIIQAVKYLKKVKIYLAGPLESINLMKIINNDINIIYLGFLDREELKDIFKKSICGLVIFLNEENHIHSQPNKLFEYMSAGLPVIASNFPLWKEIIERNDCGICVDPTDPKEIAKAIQYLLDNPHIAKKMGENGRKAVIEKYNWDIERKKLLSVYKSLTIS